MLTKDQNDPDGVLRESVVTQVFVHRDMPVATVTLTSSNGEDTLEFTGTLEHPFYVEGKGFIGLGELAAGDICVSADGTQYVVTSIVLSDAKQDVYNFEVEYTHTYYVGIGLGESVLVHNDCSQFDGPELEDNPQLFKLIEYLTSHDPYGSSKVMYRPFPVDTVKEDMRAEIMRFMLDPLYIREYGFSKHHTKILSNIDNIEDYERLATVLRIVEKDHVFPYANPWGASVIIGHSWNHCHRWVQGARKQIVALGEEYYNNKSYELTYNDWNIDNHPKFKDHATIRINFKNKDGSIADGKYAYIDNGGQYLLSPDDISQYFDKGSISKQRPSVMYITIFPSAGD